MRRIFLILLAFAMHVSLHAQQRYFFNQFTTREGLSNNSVNDIIQDKQGFIWIATDDGLNRFDGHQFKVFRHKKADSTSLAGNHIETMCMDMDGKIWCGGNGWSSVSVFNPEASSFKNIALTIADSTVHILHIFCDFNGDVWIGTSNAIFVVERNSDVAIQTVNLASDTQKPYGTAVHHGNTFAADKKRNGFWLCTNLGLNFYDCDTRTFFNFENNPQNKVVFSRRTARTIALDYNGYLWSNYKVENPFWSWVGYDYENDSIFFKQDSVKLDDVVQLHNFFSLHCSPDNKIWLGNNSRTPLIFDTETKSFNYTLAELYPGSLTNHTMKATCFDKEENSWVGTEEGLFVAFNIYKTVEVQWLGGLDKFQRPRIKSLYQPDENSILFVANKELHWWNRTSNFMNLYPVVVNGKLVDEDTRYVGKKNDDEVWVATFFGLYSFNLRTKLFTDQGVLLPLEWQRWLGTNSNILTVFTDEVGYTFICTSNGLAVFNIDKQFFNQQKSLHAGELTAQLFGNAKRVQGGWWFADSRNSRVLYLTHAEDSLHMLPLPAGLQITPFTIHEDDQHFLWIGSASEGIAKINLKDNSFQTYSIDEGLHSNCIYKILEGANKEIMAITSNGIARYNEEFDRFEKIFNEYSLPAYNHRDVGHIGKDGRLWSFSQNIFYSINPAEIQTEDRDKPVLISSVSVMNEPIASTNLLRLGSLQHQQNSIAFEFSVLNFNPNNAVQYEYMLEGLNKLWTSTEGESRIAFNGLAPGNYVFNVRSDNGTGIFSEKVSSMAFAILPPWYTTWWFRGIAFLALAAAGVFISRNYTKSKLKKREAEFEKIRLVEDERLRIARDMHDDLGGGLSSIRMMSESAQKRPDENKLKEISTSATELVERMRQIVWALNQEQNTVEDLCYYIVAHARDFLRRHEIEVSFSEVIHSDFKLSSKQRRNLFLIVKEALHNIVKHSDAKKVEIHFEMKEGTLKISIADNGKGLPRVSDNRFGNGLRNMKQRVEELGGMIEFDSDNGLKIQLTILL